MKEKEVKPRLWRVLLISDGLLWSVKSEIMDHVWHWCVCETVWNLWRCCAL